MPGIANADATATERLARHLHWSMERLDPTDSPNWDTMSERDRDLYRQCVKTLLCDVALIEAALEENAPQR